MWSFGVGRVIVAVCADGDPAFAGSPECDSDSAGKRLLPEYSAGQQLINMTGVRNFYGIRCSGTDNRTFAAFPVCRQTF